MQEKPDEFLRFSRMFHQDIQLETKSISAAISKALVQFNEHEKQKIRAYLEEILNSNLSDTEIEAIWLSSQADIVFLSGADTRVFFHQVLGLI